MKKIVAVLLASILVLQAGAITVFAESDAEITADIAVETSVDVPVETKTEIPPVNTVEDLVQTQAEDPVENSVEDPAEAKAGSPAEDPAEVKAESPAEDPVEVQAVSPAEVQTDDQSEIPEENRSEVLEEKQAQIPAEPLAEISAEPPVESQCPPPADVICAEEACACPKEFVISYNDLNVGDGIYSFRLAIRPNGTLTFDNDLQIYYQGINGRYQLNYEIEENSNHIMIVTGLFDNIIVGSPLLENFPGKYKNWVVSNISNDSYYYQLDLRTSEGFTFDNKLQFVYDSNRYGYTINYKYDLATDKQSLSIKPIFGNSQVLKYTAAQQKRVLGAASNLLRKGAAAAFSANQRFGNMLWRAF